MHGLYKALRSDFILEKILLLGFLNLYIPLYVPVSLPHSQYDKIDVFIKIIIFQVIK